ncbi:uncharacterized protein LOC131022972 [Salvia miltiorrhiza]|uniref:uncharacterized protein LOC131022972 n=1 Tax=Salvia miltiorrhiza TaxID=226208 RepID=UPI0025AD264E|nr:uncharacterized protein LOC131022972 [Salvia miltiorrhiza]
MTSNAADTMNSRLLWARCLPVASLIETYRAIMEKWFDAQRLSAASRSHELTEFDLDDIPCRHACAAIRRAGLQVTDFVGKYFKQSILLAIYMPHIALVPHAMYWNVPESISAYVVKPPDITRHAGRPKMSRARSAVEGSSRSQPQVCSRCKGQGHNARRCTSTLALDLNVPLDENESVEPPPVARRRRKKKCGICRSEDHTRNACPRRENE